MANFIDTSLIPEKGRQFVSYSEEIMETLRRIGEQVDIIAAEGMKGGATSSFVDSYHSISSAAMAQAVKIRNLGVAVQKTAAARSEIDAEAASKAQGGAGGAAMSKAAAAARAM